MYKVTCPKGTVRAVLFLTLVTCLLLSSPITTYAQQTIPVKKWVVAGIESADSNPAKQELDNQIRTLEITRSFRNKSYEGIVKYGISSTITDACAIDITGNNISIKTGRQTWHGEILETSGNTMKFKLGTLVYDFK